MKQNGAEDRKMCAVTGHKNIASLSSYDIVTSHEAGILADAIDLKPPSYESACPEAPVATAVCEPAFAAVRKRRREQKAAFAKLSKKE